MRFAGVHAQKCESVHYHLSARMQKIRSEYLLLIELGYCLLVMGGWMVTVCLLVMARWMVTVCRSTLLGLFEHQLNQKKDIHTWFSAS